LWNTNWKNEHNKRVKEKLKNKSQIETTSLIEAKMLGKIIEDKDRLIIKKDIIPEDQVKLRGFKGNESHRGRKMKNN
jgi:hypothetical protein